VAINEGTFLERPPFVSCSASRRTAHASRVLHPKLSPTSPDPPRGHPAQNRGNSLFCKGQPGVFPGLRPSPQMQLTAAAA